MGGKCLIFQDNERTHPDVSGELDLPGSIDGEGDVQRLHLVWRDDFCQLYGCGYGVDHPRQQRDTRRDKFGR